jgi:hypothetical protein
VDGPGCCACALALWVYVAMVWAVMIEALGFHRGNVGLSGVWVLWRVYWVLGWGCGVNRWLWLGDWREGEGKGSSCEVGRLKGACLSWLIL